MRMPEEGYLDQDTNECKTQKLGRDSVYLQNSREVVLLGLCGKGVSGGDGAKRWAGARLWYVMVRRL